MALDCLGKTKEKNAVIIELFKNNKTNKYHNIPHEAGITIYEHFETRTYQVNSPQELVFALNQAKEDLGGRIDSILLCSSEKNEISLGPNYDFTGTPIEISAIENNLIPNGNVLLCGNETVKQRSDGFSLSEFISKKLPNHFIIDLDTDLNQKNLKA